MAAVYISTDVSSCQLKCVTVEEFYDNIKQLHLNHNAWYQLIKYIKCSAHQHKISICIIIMQM